MTRLDVRNLLRPGPVAPRFTRTGRLREATGTRRAIAGWVPVYRQHRAALAVAGALHRARLTEQVARSESTRLNSSHSSVSRMPSSA